MAIFLPALTGCATESIRWDEVVQLREELSPRLEQFHSQRQSLQGSLSQLIYTFIDWAAFPDDGDWEDAARPGSSEFLQLIPRTAKRGLARQSKFVDELMEPLDFALDRIVALEEREKLALEPVQRELLGIGSLERYQVKSVYEGLVALEIEVLDSILWVWRCDQVVHRYRRRLSDVADLYSLYWRRIECERALRKHQSRGEFLEGDETLLRILRESCQRRQSALQESVDFLEAIDFDIFRPVRIGRYIQEPIGIAGE